MWHSSSTNGIHFFLVISLIQQFSLSMCPVLGAVPGVEKKMISRTDLSVLVYILVKNTHTIENVNTNPFFYSPF